MGSSQQDRSLGEGTFLPQWMKGRMDNRFDFTEGTFSPPAADDSFLYIPYSKPQESSSSKVEGFKSVSELFSGKGEAKVSTSTTQTLSNQTIDKSDNLNKNQLSCQPFVPSSDQNANKPKIILANLYKPKIQSSAQEFNENSAECGKSIVSVASQMMYGKSNKSSLDQSSSQSKTEMLLPKLVSKSLPATPITSPSVSPDSSPKACRRTYGNRFFTAAFVPERTQNGWFRSILGQSREHIARQKIEEEDEQNMEPVPPKTLNRKKSISSQNLTYFGKEEKVENKPETSDTKSFLQQVNILQANPSELREMNFWSPTSM